MSAMTAAKDAIAAELVKAQSKFAPFNSDHEGYAVIKEEIEELGDEHADMLRTLDYLWASTKRNSRDGARAAAEAINDAAERAAAEAIQVGAMARRFLADLPGSET